MKISLTGNLQTCVGLWTEYKALPFYPEIRDENNCRCTIKVSALIMFNEDNCVVCTTDEIRN